jgi:hypothetical protein
MSAADTSAQGSLRSVTCAPVTVPQNRRNRPARLNYVGLGEGRRWKRAIEGLCRAKIEDEFEKASVTGSAAHTELRFLRTSRRASGPYEREALGFNSAKAAKTGPFPSAARGGARPLRTQHAVTECYASNTA